jgi:hypothetical protein
MKSLEEIVRLRDFACWQIVRGCMGSVVNKWDARRDIVIGYSINLIEHIGALR